MQNLTEVGLLEVVVVRGRGNNFCAGSDIREWVHASSAQVDASLAAMEQALDAVEALGMATIAVVEGPAAGAGRQLALACDLRVLPDRPE